MWRLVLIASLWVPLTAHAAVSLDSIKSSRVSGYAPLAIHFDAFDPLNDPAMTEGQEFRDIFYSWNFGDCASNSGIWRFSDRPKCKDQGPITGHVFDPTRYGDSFSEMCGGIACARYTVKVTAYDREGFEVGAAMQAIEVYDPDNLETWCFVDTNDNDLGGPGETTEDYAGCPNTVCSSNVNDSHCVDTGDGDASYENYARANTRLVYRRGDTWVISTTITPNEGPGLVDAFGTGNDPVWQSDGSLNSKRLLRATGGNDVRFQNLDLDCNHNSDVNGSAGVEHSCIAGHNSETGSNANHLLLYRLDLTHYFRGINLAISARSLAWPESQAVVEVTLRDQIVPSSRLKNMICNKFSGSTNRIHGITPMWIGNEVADATATEQNLRHMWFSRLVVNHNSFAGGGKSICGNADARSTVDIRSCKSTQGGAKCVASGQRSEYYYFTGNRVAPSTTKQVIGIQTPTTPQTVGEHISVNDVIIDGNYIRLGRPSYATTSSNPTGCIAFIAGQDLTDDNDTGGFERITFRNNTVDAQHGDYSTERCGPVAWLTMSRSSAKDAVNEHNSVWVANSTLIGRDNCGNACKSIGMSDAQTCRDNLLFAPGVDTSDINLCSTDTHALTNPYLSNSVNDHSHSFRLEAGSAAIDAASSHNLPWDIGLNCRTGTGIDDDGAWEFGTASCAGADMGAGSLAAPFLLD